MIHRGAHQIGGSCIELSSDDTRIVLDLGLPLEGDDPAGSGLAVPGLFEDEGRGVDALFLSHAHADHSGLIAASRREIPVWMTEGTSKMLLCGSLFAVQPSVPKHRVRILREREPVRVGPFSVSAFPVDHSAYGSAAFLVEAEGKRVLYTGDLRFHGRKPGFSTRLARAAANVDAVLIEGTRFGARATEANVSEADLEERMIPEMTRAPGLVLAMFSPLNVDRFVTLFRTTRQAKRTFVIDPYQAFVLHLIHRQTRVPIAGGPADLRVLIPPRFAQTRAGRAVTRKRWWRSVAGAAITREQILAAPRDFVLLYRISMEPWLRLDRRAPTTTCIYGYWPGYLRRDPKLKAWAETFRRCGGALLVRHASGHGHPKDLRRFVESINPRWLIPVHTTAPEAWSRVWKATLQLADGISFSV